MDLKCFDDFILQWFNPACEDDKNEILDKWNYVKFLNEETSNYRVILPSEKIFYLDHDLIYYLKNSEAALVAQMPYSPDKRTINLTFMIKEGYTDMDIILFLLINFLKWYQFDDDSIPLNKKYLSSCLSLAQCYNLSLYEELLNTLHTHLSKNNEPTIDDVDYYFSIYLNVHLMETITKKNVKYFLNLSFDQLISYLVYYYPHTVKAYIKNNHIDMDVLNNLPEIPQLPPGSILSSVVLVQVCSFPRLKQIEYMRNYEQFKDVPYVRIPHVGKMLGITLSSEECKECGIHVVNKYKEINGHKPTDDVDVTLEDGNTIKIKKYTHKDVSIIIDGIRSYIKTKKSSCDKSSFVEFI